MGYVRSENMMRIYTSGEMDERMQGGRDLMPSRTKDHEMVIEVNILTHISRKA